MLSGLRSCNLCLHDLAWLMTGTARWSMHADMHTYMVPSQLVEG